MTDNLKNLVGQLSNLSDKDKIVLKLQEINKCFLQNYIIQIGNLKIYPVEVEIYYYDNEGIFQDGNCHQNELQKNRFGKLYFHRAGRSKGKDDLIDTNYYGGIDVCISRGKYFLSILIRSAYIKNRKNEERFITGIHRIVNSITDELEYSLEQGCINSIEYDVLEEEKNKLLFLKEQIKKEKRNNIFKFKCNNRKRIQSKKFFEHEEIEKKNYDEYKLNTYIDNENITSKMVKPKE